MISSQVKMIDVYGNAWYYKCIIKRLSNNDENLINFLISQFMRGAVT